MVSFVGWLNGLSLVILLIFEVLFGLYLIISSLKTKAKRLRIIGITLCFVGLAHTECSVSFIYYLITRGNLYEISARFFLFNSIMVCFEVFFATYLGIEINVEGIKKKIFTVLNFILASFFIFFLILDLENNYTVFIPPIGSPTEGSMIWNTKLGTLFSLILVIWIGLIIYLLSYGSFRKGLRSEGVVRKKYFLLSFGVILLCFSQAIAGFSTSFVLLTILRTTTLIASSIMYFSLREEPLKKEKNRTKEIQVEGDLFRLYKINRENITEEEIVFHKENKLCLVCKNKVEGFTYICPECDALYCQKCAQVLANLENTCWACDALIDKSKPKKKFKGEEDIRIHRSDELKNISQ